LTHQLVMVYTIEGKHHTLPIIKTFLSE
jgi:hypothetical protein